MAVILAVAARQGAGKNMIHKVKTILKHLWLDASDAQKALPADMLQRLALRIAASEGRHTGQIRIYVEAALPMSYLWRLGQSSTMKALTRQRAVMQFGKLLLWDTEHNNGVLIYLQLAEHAIEIIADRGVDRHVSTHDWQAMAQRMSAAFSAGHFEDGLTQAIGEVSSVLVAHFPAAPGSKPVNEQPNEPVLG